VRERGDSETLAECGKKQRRQCFKYFQFFNTCFFIFAVGHTREISTVDSNRVNLHTTIFPINGSILKCLLDLDFHFSCASGVIWGHATFPARVYGLRVQINALWCEVSLDSFLRAVSMVSALQSLDYGGIITAIIVLFLTKSKYYILWYIAILTVTAIFLFLFFKSLFLSLIII